MISWHRLFGITLTDYFSDSSYAVTLEEDLSLKQQLLDVVIVQTAKEEKKKLPDDLPDGLENLGPYNLITYKSHQDTLDDFAIYELCGHYVNYRKKISPSFDHLLPAGDFRLYAVSARYPQNLANQVDFENAGQGVYDVRWGSRSIRLIVLSRIAETKKNAPWLMFSAVPEKVRYGAAHYAWHTQVSSIMNHLFQKYNMEGMTMPYTVDDYLKENKEEMFKYLTQEDIDRILKGLKPEDRLKGLTTEEVFKRFKPEDLLKRLSLKEIEEYLKKIKQ